MLAAILAALIFQSNAYRVEYPLPGADLNGIGVDIHFIQPPAGEVEQIARAGFKWVRMDFLWTLVEKHRGTYYFKDYDLLMDSLDRNDIRPIFIFDTIQDTYGASPSDSNVRGAFCNFVQASVEHFKHRGIVWELWNEPNLDDYWKPHANADEYAELAKEAGQTIRGVSPDEWIIGPALSHTDWPFLEKIFQDGVLDIFDGVTMHPYRSDPPETVAGDWTHLAGLIDKFKPAHKRIAMLCAEWGYSDLLTGADVQAQYAVRMFLVNLMSGVDMTVWYDWKDDAGSPEARQRHFGIVHDAPGDKPVSAYLLQLKKELQGFRLERRADMPEGQFGLFFAKGDQRRLVAWTESDEGADISVDPKFKRGVVLGQQTEPLDGTGKFHISSTPTVFE